MNKNIPKLFKPGKPGLVGFDIAYTDGRCKLTIEWNERIDLESASSPQELSARSVDLLRRILEAALATVTTAVDKGDVGLPTFGEPS